MKKIVCALIGLFTAVAANAHSDAFQPAFVDRLLDPYLKIQTALAADELPAAREAAGLYLEVMKDAPVREAAEESAELRKPAEQLQAASELGAARLVFAELSSTMKVLVKHVGVTTSTPLFVVRCSMAFDGEGAEWIQAGETVANPYFGQQMSGCGSTEEQIAGTKGMAAHHENQRDRPAHLHLH